MLDFCLTPDAYDHDSALGSEVRHSVGSGDGVALLTASVAMPALCPLWLSIGQWVVLRRYVTKAWQWLLATVVGGYLAFTVLFLFAMLLVQRQRLILGLPSSRIAIV